MSSDSAVKTLAANLREGAPEGWEVTTARAAGFAKLVGERERYLSPAGVVKRVQVVIVVMPDRVGVSSGFASRPRAVRSDEPVRDAVRVAEYLDGVDDPRQQWVNVREIVEGDDE